MSLARSIRFRLTPIREMAKPLSVAARFIFRWIADSATEFAAPIVPARTSLIPIPALSAAQQRRQLLRHRVAMEQRNDFN